MADLRASGLGGVPKGTTADRPSSPSIGDLFYNGTLGNLEIYTNNGWVATGAPPLTPSISVVNSPSGRAYNNGRAAVTVTPSESGGLPISYRVVSEPGSYTGTSTTTTVNVNGLQSNTSYTFTATAINNYGISAATAASSSITATTVPQAPSISSVVGGNQQVLVNFSANATGGSSITGYTVTSSPGNLTATGSSSPLTVSGLTNGTSYTFTATATNTNGTSLASSASSEVIPVELVITGGTLSSDSTYNYRTFTSSGTLGVTGSLTADILVIAGGGGPGGFASAGAGGAGGLVYLPSQSLTTSNYTVTVGAGGVAGGNSFHSVGTQGDNSRFGSLTEAIGGGYGRSYNASDNLSAYRGGDGGSGGGGGSINGFGGNGTAGQGNAGGRGQNGYDFGGGGGGAVSAGNIQHAGAGSGEFSSWGIATSTGVNVGGVRYYAGGGNNSGGTTTNGAAAENVSGAANTGQGAGSVYGSKTTGGSGIVIIRWAK